MGNIFFIIGGARSGKSSYAVELGSGFPGRKGFIATAEAFDEEMKARISLHQKTRPLEWETIEEPVDLSKRLQNIAGLYDVVIVDCLTLWLSNMLGREEDSEPPKGNENPPSPLPSPLRGEGQGEGVTRDNENTLPFKGRDRVGMGAFSSERIKAEIERLASVLKDVSCKVIVVSNEVGLGIVPENKIARLFRDLGGWMNQKVASVADEVYLVTCGIPMKLK